MDFCEEKEHIISSDEYSDEDEGDDALMNDALRAEGQNSRVDDFSIQKKLSNWKIDQKQKQISSLIRRNKISVIYKKKSIKWLNSKNQREIYKKRLNQVTGDQRVEQISYPSEVSLPQKHNMNEDRNRDGENNVEVYIADTFSVKGKENDVNLKSNTKKILEGRTAIQNNSSDLIINVLQEKTRFDFDEKNTINQEGKMKPKENIEEIKGISRKRSRSESPAVLNESNDIRAKCNENVFKHESQQLYEGINGMFPNFDKIVSNHINKFANNSLPIVNEKLNTLSNEIDSLNEIIQSKEKEINRLSHLKMVKEEIYYRLCKKKNNLQLRGRFTDKQQLSLQDLKEVELFLSDSKGGIDKHNSSETIQKLIESRANMNSDDLKREKSNTSRLHSLLVSQNMLHATGVLESTCFTRNMKRLDTEKTYQCGEEMRSNSKARQGKVRDVKSLIADFRNKNPDLIAHVGKRTTSTESSIQQANSAPLNEKISQLFNKDKFELFSLPNSIHDISLTPVGNSKLSSSLENVRVGATQSTKTIKGNINGRYNTNMQYPLCQECKTNESRFVCAGCGNQWYCSKNCQITAWDRHCDLCME